MSFPYDAASKFFLSLSPKDWLTLIGRPVDAEVSELNSELSTVSAAADKLILVNGPVPLIEHIEVQSSRDIDLPIRVCRYGILALYEKRRPINSTVILLRPEADGPELTGLYEVRLPDGTLFLHYRYRVIRLWEIAPQAFLDAGIAVLPLATLGKIEKDELPAFIREVRVRVERELSPSEWVRYWTGIVILMGLKFDSNSIQESLKGIGTMISLKDSSIVRLVLDETRQEALQEGRQEGLREGAVLATRKHLLDLITLRFGTVNSKWTDIVEALSDLTQMEQLLSRAYNAPTVERMFDLGGD